MHIKQNSFKIFNIIKVLKTSEVAAPLRLYHNHHVVSTH